MGGQGLLGTVLQFGKMGKFWSLPLPHCASLTISNTGWVADN